MFQDMSKDFDIKRIKRSNTSCSTGVGAHVHPFNEIFYLSSGECTSFIDHNIYKFGKGDLVIVPSGCLHRTTYNGKGMHERIVISFRNEATEWIQNQTGKELMENCMKPGVVNIPEKRRDYVVALLDKLLFENDSPDELSPAFIKVGLIELLLFIIRCKNYEENVIKEIDVDNRIIQEVATYIYEHYADNLSLENVAEIFNLSRSYLSKKFKTATGFGFKEYIINVRIQNACRLLNVDLMTVIILVMHSGRQREFRPISIVRMKHFRIVIIRLYLILYNFFNIIVLKNGFCIQG